MSYRYVDMEPGLLVREDAVTELAGVNGAIFDVDGVLVDVAGSYPMVISAVTQFYFEEILKWPGRGGAVLVHPEEVALFKQAGGFNSDWAVAQAAVLFYLWKAGQTGLQTPAELRQAPPSLASLLEQVKAAGGGLRAVQQLAPPDSNLPAPWDPALVERLCEEHYGGDDWCEEMFGYKPAYWTGKPGYFNTERPLIDPAELERWPGKAGIYTGRVYRETVPALKLCKIDRFLGGVMPEAAVITASHDFRKPDPTGLRLAVQAMDATRTVYCGDNVDDWATADNYRRLADARPLLFAGILGGTLGDRAEAIFREKGAEIIAADVNRVLRYLRARSGANTTK